MTIGRQQEKDFVQISVQMDPPVWKHQFSATADHELLASKHNRKKQKDSSVARCVLIAGAAGRTILGSSTRTALG